MTEIIDRSKTFRLLEQRIARTTNPRHLLMLNRLLQHTIGEAELDVNLVMSTLAADPRYIAWGAPADMSPVGREAVQSFYEETIAKGGQFPIRKCETLRSFRKAHPPAGNGNYRQRLSAFLHDGLPAVEQVCMETGAQESRD